MFIELHILQNFAPSNLNRDDTNAPKDCDFGGYRRARISSQCLKRAIRREFGAHNLLPAQARSVRTKRLVEELTRRFTAQGKDEEQAQSVAEAAIGGLGLALDKKNVGQTEYLLFLGAREIARLAETCLQHWDTIAASTAIGKKDKTALGEVGKALQDVLDGGRAVDLALFGRMLADIPQRNVDAAAQVAHAISTHQVSTEFDFFTAVDDLRPETTEGAGMMGTVEFNSACFYRYLNVDLNQLLSNLQGDEALAREGLRALLQATIEAVPTGKQNSMAAQNPPSLVFIVARERGLQNLANAFVRPVRPGQDMDVVAESAAALGGYWTRLTGMYGSDGVASWLATTEDVAGLPADGPMTVQAAIDCAVSAARFAA